MAGALWSPPEQLPLEDFVGTADLPSAIRLNSTAYLAVVGRRGSGVEASRTMV